ncbi:hypothetical protein ACOMHN_003671 [Nucella lapillus]
MILFIHRLGKGATLTCQHENTLTRSVPPSTCGHSLTQAGSSQPLLTVTAWGLLPTDWLPALAAAESDRGALEPFRVYPLQSSGDPWSSDDDSHRGAQEPFRALTPSVVRRSLVF